MGKSCLIALLLMLAALGARADSVTGSHNAQAADADADVYLFVLGVAQDAGYPQTNCYRPHCLRAWRDTRLRRLTSSIAVIDRRHGAKYLFDATPDLPQQLYDLHLEAPDATHPLDGVFLTHGHMGHYTGLMHFGREAAATDAMPVFAMPRMLEYLAGNGPWSQLVELRNIALIPVENAAAVRLNGALSVVPLQVPHRDEFSETVGYEIIGPHKRALFIPDIDKWQAWELDIRELVRRVDYALLDGSFFSDGELPGRDMSKIPHPLVQESMALFSGLPDEDRAKVFFIHFNHSNPLLIDGSDAQSEVRARGFNIARQGMRLPL